MAIFEFLFYALLAYYIIRSIIRLVLPMLFQSVVNKAQQGGQQQQHNYRAQEPTGRIKVEYIPEQTKKQHIPDSEGEFISYEEVK